MTTGKERILFDCVGTLADPHVIKCCSCDHEFRYQQNLQNNEQYELICLNCEVQEIVSHLPSSTFEVIGLIETP